MITLSPVETRVLGCMLEKERTTPESYPLTLNALINACNQTTAREPVMIVGDRDAETALDELRQKKLATVVFGAGSRVQKYRHILPDTFNFTPQESALLCVLLLRGPQTAGELRARAERLSPFPALTDVENALGALMAMEQPLVRHLPARPGQKERRYVQLLSGEPEDKPQDDAAAPVVEARTNAASRVELLEREVEGLRGELAELRARFEDFRRQLGG